MQAELTLLLKCVNCKHGDQMARLPAARHHTKGLHVLMNAKAACENQLTEMRAPAPSEIHLNEACFQ